MEILTEPALYFASELDEAIQGSDWDEETVVVTSMSTVLYWAVQVIRVMVSRAEVDLRLVADRYHRLSGRQLDKAITVEFCLQHGAPLFIQADTGGDFQWILLKMLQPELKLP